eukprot:scaffold47745_cov68-Phaeocystis_antarctica.AAC.3
MGACGVRDNSRSLIHLPKTKEITHLFTGGISAGITSYRGFGGGGESELGRLEGLPGEGGEDPTTLAGAPENTTGVCTQSFVVLSPMVKTSPKKLVQPTLRAENRPNEASEQRPRVHHVRHARLHGA